MFLTVRLKACLLKKSSLELGDFRPIDRPHLRDAMPALVFAPSMKDFTVCCLLQVALYHRHCCKAVTEDSLAEPANGAVDKRTAMCHVVLPAAFMPFGTHRRLYYITGMPVKLLMRTACWSLLTGLYASWHT